MYFSYTYIIFVDTKILKLAQILSGKVVTNDFNLNKVAEFQGVPVLNINELANAIKPVLLPGEEMKVMVMKDGKESSQGIAYLDDGTMIVVEEGRRYIGKNIRVLVNNGSCYICITDSCWQDDICKTKGKLKGVLDDKCYCFSRWKR